MPNYSTNRFYVAYEVRLSVSLILFTHFEVICELLRSLKKHDGNGNGNVTKQKCLKSRTMAVHVNNKSL